MERMLTLGVIVISSFSIGSGEECCKHKQVGEHVYHYAGVQDTFMYGCDSQCVYRKEGQPENNHFCFAAGKLKSVCKYSDDVKPYHQFYSGLSSLHGHLKSLLTPEQAGMFPHPEGCSNCTKPKYCWHGSCVGEDEKNFPPGNHSDYIDSITKIRTNLSFVNQSAWSACSEFRIECYGVCLDVVLNTLASCYLDHNITTCLKGKQETVSECLPCVCQLIKEHWPQWPCPEVSKYKVPGIQCNRDCIPNSPPLKCVFALTLEVLKTDVLNTDSEGRRADGRNRSVLAYNGQIPGPPIVICEGDELVVNFKNNITGNMTNIDGSGNTSTLHFHGIREKTRPWSDGVPFVTQCPVTPMKDFSYGFNTSVDGAPPGTYWYHSHVGAQRTNGAYGALIIKNKKKVIDDVIDDAANTLVLQEWYESSTNQVPVSILINGAGRVGPTQNKVEDEAISNHLKGNGSSFNQTENKHFNPENFTTNYTVFHVKQPGKSYRFRVIGAISQNFPLRVSIDDHKFTAIAMDSLNIEPVPDLTYLWLTAGERYDIEVQTKKRYNSGRLRNINIPAHKIRVIGYTDPSDKSAGALCTIAWLKYPGQSINHTYVTDSKCTGFDLPSSDCSGTNITTRTLNPVPNSITAWTNRIQYPDWENTTTTGDIFIADLRAIKPEPTIKWNLNTHYIEFDGRTSFNNMKMTYPRVPFLLQDPANETDRCGSECTGHVGDGDVYTNCTTKTSADCADTTYCNCQNVLKEPWAPGYWTEIMLVNNYDGPAHPIHQHGGWYWVVGEGQYDHIINKGFIMEQDKLGKLPRNLLNPPAKDTIQVPTRGYVIIRTPLDNAGTWIFHCHINYHVTVGMAMVLQIGELGKSSLEGQDWCTGPLQRNVECNTPPPGPFGGPSVIYWNRYIGIDGVKRCVAPGNTVTFSWILDNHNVIEINESDYESCNTNHYPNSTIPTIGDYVWTAPTTLNETHYFACGRWSGDHCRLGMKAKIHVRNDCTH